MLDTLDVKWLVIAFDKSNLLLRAVGQLKSRAWHAHPGHADVHLEADPGGLVTYRSIPGASGQPFKPGTKLVRELNTQLDTEKARHAGHWLHPNDFANVYGGGTSGVGTSGGGTGGAWGNPGGKKPDRGDLR